MTSIALPLSGTLAEFDRAVILWTVAHCGGDRGGAAQMLGICKKTLHNKLKQCSDAWEAEAAGEEGLPIERRGRWPRRSRLILVPR